MDDVVQEVFAIIHARLHTLRQPESLRSWLYGVVRRIVSGHRRSRRSKWTSESSLELAEALAGQQLTPLEQTERRAQLQLLAKLLAELDDAKREVFVLAELDEMTMPEVAAALDIPLNTAYSRLRAGREAFEQALARYAARERGRP